MNIAQVLSGLFKPDSKHKRGRSKPHQRKRYRDKCRERFVISGLKYMREEYIYILVNQQGCTKKKAKGLAKANMKRREVRREV